MSESVLPISESLLTVPESAGYASFRSFDHSNLLYPLQLDACVDWNADTGATSHMTPHRYWLHNYVPKRIPIKLADNKTVYSAGEGTVVFNPIVNGKAVRPLEFSRVLHVPDLRNNLFSVLFLTRHKGFTVSIDSTKMSFQQPAGNTLFTATISDSSAAFLDGTTVPLTEYASAATTLSLDLVLVVWT